MFNKSKLIINLKTFFSTILSFSLSKGLYYKHLTIVNDDSSIVNKLWASLTDNARIIIYDCHMFIVQAIGACTIKITDL
jgi:hypothetical protein